MIKVLAFLTVFPILILGSSEKCKELSSEFEKKLDELAEKTKKDSINEKTAKYRIEIEKNVIEEKASNPYTAIGFKNDTQLKESERKIQWQCLSGTVVKNKKDSDGKNEEEEKIDNSLYSNGQEEKINTNSDAENYLKLCKKKNFLSGSKQQFKQFENYEYNVVAILYVNDREKARKIETIGPRVCEEGPCNPEVVEEENFPNFNPPEVIRADQPLTPPMPISLPPMPIVITPGVN